MSIAAGEEALSSGRSTGDTEREESLSGKHSRPFVETFHIAEEPEQSRFLKSAYRWISLARGNRSVKTDLSLIRFSFADAKGST